MRLRWGGHLICVSGIAVAKLENSNEVGWIIRIHSNLMGLKREMTNVAERHDWQNDDLSVMQL